MEAAVAYVTRIIDTPLFPASHLRFELNDQGWPLDGRNNRRRGAR